MFVLLFSTMSRPSFVCTLRETKTGVKFLVCVCILGKQILILLVALRKAFRLPTVTQQSCNKPAQVCSVFCSKTAATASFTTNSSWCKTCQEIVNVTYYNSVNSSWHIHNACLVWTTLQNPKIVSLSSQKTTKTATCSHVRRTFSLVA